MSSRQAKETNPQAKLPAWREALTSPEALVIGCVLFSFALLWPVGHFAVDDEWAFLKSLQHLDGEGRVRISPWNPMSLVGHLYWGLVFTKMAGFSFTAARLSSVVMFAVLGLSVAGLLRHIGASRRATVIALLALMFNPLCLFHGFLYMTDVPASAWTALAVLLLVKGLERENQAQPWWLLAGSLCGAFGFLLRQSGLLVHVALVVFLLLYDRRRILSPAAFIACFVVPAITAATFQYWYLHVHGSTIMYREESHKVLESLRHPDARELPLAVFQYGVYLGLFTLPVLVGLPLAFWRQLTRWRLAALGVVAVLSAVAVGVLAGPQQTIFPYLPNKLTQFGFLSLDEVIVGDRPLVWGHQSAWVVTILLTLAWLGVAGVALRKTYAATTTEAPAALRFVAILGAIQLSYLVVTFKIAFDRHMLLILPAAILLVVGWTRDCTINRTAPAVVLAFLAFYGLAGTHDVYSFSRAAFRAGDSLIAKGVSPMSIDGGYPFDGWYTFEAWQHEGIRRARPSDSWWVQSLMQGIETRWLLSLSPTIDEQAYHQWGRVWMARNPPDIRDYHPVETVPYTTWLPPGRRELYVLERP